MFFLFNISCVFRHKDIIHSNTNFWVVWIWYHIQTNLNRNTIYFYDQIRWFLSKLKCTLPNLFIHFKWPQQLCGQKLNFILAFVLVMCAQHIKRLNKHFFRLYFRIKACLLLGILMYYLYSDYHIFMHTCMSYLMRTVLFINFGSSSCDCFFLPKFVDSHFFLGSFTYLDGHPA